VDTASDKAAALALTPVSRETEARLDHLVELVLAGQSRMNLVAASTLPTIWTRHVADSLQLLPLAPAAKTWIDLGSGAGFPGLVIACALAGQPGAAVHLVESKTKKAEFLRETARELGLPAEVHPHRIEEWAASWPGKAEIVTARALAPLPKLLGYAAPLIARGVKGIFLKGQDVVGELTETARYWNIRAETVPSVTDSRSRIVIVSRARRIAT
jgi:16S rRNA (guanine527-N7)-methyltransferase